ncbi:MAG: tryptophan--tRNA ligase, partial [Saprospiraceae bacterium]
YIDMFAPIDSIRKQIRSAVTDTGEVKTNEMSPGIQNLFSLLKASKSNRYPEFMDAYQNKNLQYSSLKDAVADAIIEMVIPIQKRKEELLTNKKELKDHIKKAGAQIRERAAQTVRDVKSLTGIGS